MKLRAKPNKRHVLSLSGGLDSRAILAAFRILDIPHKQVTYNLGGSTNADLNSVRKLVDITNPQFKLIQLEPENKYSEKLFQMKEGLNYLGMSFLIEFLEIIQEKYDYYWTGDGGDKLLPDTSPLRNLFSLKDLTNYTLQTQQILNPNEIGEILPVNSKGIAQHISQHFESYPEKGYSDKFRRFLYLERAYKWLFEGEDRNRYFLTSVSPFYAIPFFKFAMSIPTETKSDFKIFREFLNLLDPKIASIENANWGVSINQKKEINRIYNKQKIKSYLSIFLDLEKNNIQEKKYHIDTLQKVMRKLSYE